MPPPKNTVPNPPAPGQPELPVQAQCEEPIINGPYDEPQFWWDYEKGTGRALKMTGRRAASYFWTTQKVMTGQQSLEGMESDFGSEKLELVNRLREDVARWRESDYENATQTTKKLLRHWRSEDRKRRFFFCQIEAVETIIYLRELLAAGRARRGKAGVTRGDNAALLHPGADALSGRRAGDLVRHFPDRRWAKDGKR